MKLIFTGIFLFLAHLTFSQKSADDVTISGFIRDDVSGESLIGATVILTDSTSNSTHGTTTNAYGFFSLTVPRASYTLTCSYIGYQTAMPESFTWGDQLEIRLKEDAVTLDAVVISEDRNATFLNSTLTGVSSIGIQEIKQLPSFFGEPDLIKTVQLLPGVNVMGEGSSNLYIRGGAADQNLILLDEAPVYSPSHLLGFFSVFNSDAMKHAELHKSGIPARYGGRTSAVLDVRMKEGNNERFSGSGGIGSLASRLTLEGPLKKGASAFMVSARRTYADLFLKLSADEFTRRTKLYFYDINAKMNFRAGNRDRLYFSGYFGRDVFRVDVLRYGIDWGNQTFTTRWNHLFSDRAFANTTFIYSNYDYRIDLDDTSDAVNWTSTLRDFTLKSDITYGLNNSQTFDFGASLTNHTFHPGNDEEDPEGGIPGKEAIDAAIYAQGETELSGSLAISYGLRYGLFMLYGNSIEFTLDDNHEVMDEVAVNGVYRTFGGLEPRASARYELNPYSSVKLSYDRTRQYMMSLSNLSLGLNVFDFWLPVSNNISPQVTDQIAAGYYRSFGKGKYQLTAETYYKFMENHMLLADHASLLMNRQVETEIRQGNGRAYGLELSVRKETGRLSGWVSYTLSNTEVRNQDINDGNYFPANYDQRHSFSNALRFRMTDRLILGMNFSLSTGRPFTFAEESYSYEGTVVPVYGPRNGSRLPVYHRLDLSVELKGKKARPDRRWEGSWNFGLYNVYNQYNAASIFLSPELSDLGEVKDHANYTFHKLYLFGIVPSITYNFSF